ncbi:collagen alpha-1(X) chain-like, partial [Ruditapes philippinarum]|uniref:collagen alpha-1(X) chain-like n=1 Tax=Ruditapes philippinarum TaxID=129788 RepID=UPI00295C39DC
MGVPTVFILVLCVTTSSAWWLKPKPAPPAPPQIDHSTGIPCPGTTYQKCLSGFRCQEGNGKIECVKSLDKIAFEAYTTNSKGHFSDGKVLVFPNVILNDGQGYNPKTGIFKAPTAGVYQFTVHVCSARNKHMVVGIFKGEQQIAITTVYEEPYSSCTSHSALIRVEKNEFVSVKARYGDSNLESDTYRWPSFSG